MRKRTRKADTLDAITGASEMTDYHYEDTCKMNEIFSMSFQSSDPEQIYTWVDERYEVLVRFYCSDGIKYILVEPEWNKE